MSDIRLGFYPEDHAMAGKPLSYPGDGHLILVAPTRSGKGRDILTPALLSARRSCIIIDPKAQLAAITKRRRSQFGKVLVLNPFNILRERLGDQGGPQGGPARFNPMDTLNPADDAFTADCDNLAEGIVSPDPGGKDDRHFTDSARQLVSGVIMHLVSDPACPTEKKTLGFMREVVTRNIFRFAQIALESGTNAVKERLARFADPKAYEGREIPSILSVANTHSAFLGIEAIAQSVSGSDFQFRDLRSEEITVYLTLPTRYLGAAGKWFRLVVASALNALLQEPKDGEDVPVLAVLDEFAQLGELTIIKDAMALAAGYGLQLFPVLQDLNQLKTYGEHVWPTFLANSAVQMYFAPRENTTADYLSKMSGEKEVSVPSESLGEASGPGKTGGPGKSGASVSWKHEVVPEQRLHDVLRLPNNEFFLFRQGQLVIRTRAPYFDETRFPEFKGLYDPDPYYRPRKS